MMLLRFVVDHLLPRAWRGAAAAPICVLLLALGACNGTAVVTLTSTASADNFLAYRVALVSVQLQGSSGSSALTVLPQSTTLDFAALTDLSEVLGVAGVKNGTYTSALITLDYSAAQIVYDDGSLNGVLLTPVGAGGQALDKIQLTATLDPSDSFSVTAKGASQLALDFKMAASNLVNFSAKTLTVTPFIAASAAPIDSKQVRIRGALAHVINTSTATTGGGSFTLSALPFSTLTGSNASLSIVTGDLTTYEVNGEGSTGSTGLGQLAALGSGTLTVAYGTLVSDGSTTTTTSGGTDSSSVASTVTFAATQVLAGGSVQGAGRDRVSGTVSARSGNTVTVEDGTLIAVDGTETFLGGTTVIILGLNTLVTEFGQGGTEIDSLLQVSVGSVIDAFGIVTAQSAQNATLDASAGRVRLDTVTVSGLVNVQGLGALDINIAKLGGRSVGAFDFVGSGATPANYVVNTGALDLSNSTAGQPVSGTGFSSAFGAALPNFTAATLLDPTTLVAQLVIDWPAGTATPFTYDSSSIEIDLSNGSIGTRHAIQVGAQSFDAVALGSARIVPAATTSETVFSIGHVQGSTTESFNSYAAFISQLQTEFNGGTLATGITATGVYTQSTFTLNATSITLFVNN